MQTRPTLGRAAPPAAGCRPAEATAAAPSGRARVEGDRRRRGARLLPERPRAVSAAPRSGANSLSAVSETRMKRERRNAAARSSDAGLARNPRSASTSLISSASKKPKPFVDVKGHAPEGERILEQAVALTRSEQNADVARPDGPPNTRLPIADRRAAREHTCDLLGCCFGLRLVRRRRDQRQRLTFGRLHGGHRKPIIVAIAKRVGPFGRLVDRPEQIVGKRKQFADRSKTVRDCGADLALRTECFDVPRCLVEYARPRHHENHRSIACGRRR